MFSSSSPVSVRLRQGLLLCTALGLGACATPVTLRHYADPMLAQSELGEFAWLPGQLLVQGLAAEETARLEDTLRQSTRSELERKGYRFVDDPQQADFFVGFLFAESEHLNQVSYPEVDADLHAWTMPDPADVSWRASGRGQLHIDVIRVDDRRLLWHGLTDKPLRISDAGAPRVLDRAVTIALETFPDADG